MLANTLRNSATLCLSFAILTSLAVAQETVTQEAYIKASNAGHSDQLGCALSMSGDTLIVGAPREGSHAVGVNGDQDDNSSQGNGAAYVFIRSGTEWSQQAYLKPPTFSPLVRAFGFSVAIEGNTAVVSGDIVGAGTVHVFERTGTDWAFEATLSGSNSEPGDGFGRSVAIANDTVYVGASGEGSSSSGINGDMNDNSHPRSGAVYVFVRAGSSWAQQAYIKGPASDAEDTFGSQVAASGNKLAITAPGEDSAAFGLNGDWTDNSHDRAGAAYVYVRTGTVWAIEAYVKASNSDALVGFGSSCSIHGDNLVIGAASEGSSASGINGDQYQLPGDEGVGAAYVFTRTAGLWSQEAYIKASNPVPLAYFGHAVAISDDKLVVGSPQESNNTAGVNGNQDGGLLSNSGAIHTFERTGAGWEQTAYIKAAHPLTRKRFGCAVAVVDDVVCAGDYYEGGSSTGINGDPTDFGLHHSGAVFVFNLETVLPNNMPGLDLCSGDGGDQLGCANCPCMNNAAQGTVGGCLNSAATSARLTATGDTSVSLHFAAATDLRFSLSGLPGSAFSVLTSGDSLSPTNTANPCFGISNGVQSVSFDGMRCAVLNTRRHSGRLSDPLGEVGTTNNPWGGEASPQAGIAAAGLGFIAGQTRYFQAIYRDDATLSCMRGLNTSQAIEIVFTP